MPPSVRQPWGGRRHTEMTAVLLMRVIQAADDGIFLRVRVQPRASVERVEGVCGDQVRVRLTAPPVDGAANAACVALLAKVLGVSRSRVRLHTGIKSRDKLLYISGLTPAQAAEALGIPLP